MKKQNPKVSVIITTRNSALTLRELLESIKKQRYGNYELIIVDNNSTDDTVNISKEYSRKVYNKGNERSVQRNYGVSKAHGKYVLILDSDMVLTEKVIEECVEKSGDNQKIGAVVIPEKSFGVGFWAKVKVFERELVSSESYIEAARFFPIKIFREFMGYDENLTGPEDWDLPQRISVKYEIVRIKSKILHNEGNPTVIKFAKRKYYYGLTTHRYLKKHGIGIIGPRTIYFLRPVFYRNLLRLIKHPVLTLGLIVMLTFEMIGGGLGYVKGRFGL